jgi:hypothetical protein
LSRICGKSATSNTVTKSVSQNIEHGNYLHLKIHGKLIRGLLDTGSGTTLIRSNLAHKLNFSIRPVQGQLSCLFTAKGAQLIVDVVDDVTFNISGLFVDHTVYVVANIAESSILGSDFLSHNHVVIDYSSKTVSLRSDLVRAPIVRNGDGQQVARLTKIWCIPPGNERIVDVNCAPRFSNSDVLVEAMACSQFSQFAVARSICRTDKQSQTVARMLNCLPHTLVLPKALKLPQCKTFMFPHLVSLLKCHLLELKLSVSNLNKN